MRRLSSPRSGSFRAVLGMALLAWAVLATGALAGPLRGINAMRMDAAMQMTASQAGVGHCAGGRIRQTDSRHASTTPVGHGECCHGVCHCLSMGDVVLSVPDSLVTGVMPRAALPVFAYVDPVPAPAAPPLRPPIA